MGLMTGRVCAGQRTPHARRADGAAPARGLVGPGAGTAPSTRGRAGRAGGRGRDLDKGRKRGAWGMV